MSFEDLLKKRAELEQRLSKVQSQIEVLYRQVSTRRDVSGEEVNVPEVDDLESYASSLLVEAEKKISELEEKINKLSDSRILTV